MRSLPIAALVLLLATPVQAQNPAPADLRAQVEAELAKAPAGTRFGVLVVDDAGREVLAINPDQRFIPASNTKLFTTALALDAISRDPAAAIRGGTVVRVLDKGKGAPDVVIEGGGGVSLSTAPDCKSRCLAGLADKLAAVTRKIGDVVGDDTMFVDQHWSPGMSWNNIQTDSGTATSALIVDDNEALLTVTPSAPGQSPVVTVSPYFTLRNEAVTVAAGETRLAFERAVNSREVRLHGTIAAGAPVWRDLLGIDEPAHYAAWALQQSLQARGVKVSGKVRVIHRPVQLPGRPDTVANPAGKARIAFIEPPTPLAEEVTTINKRSQNLHAEALLRLAGLAAGAQDIFSSGEPVQAGSLEAGLQAMRAMLDRVGVPRTGYDFSDGSGMSTYNRISPRATVALLRWGAKQAWGGQWRASLPVGGVDGTLRRRFAGTPLQGKVFAKTGTLNATNTLSGYMIAASGRELTFSLLANDVPADSGATGVIDAALAVIARAN